MFGERERYGRRSFREQLDEVVEWARSHRRWILGALVVLVVLGSLALQAQPVRPQDLAVGDCLFVRTVSADGTGPGARPIGEPQDVVAGVLAGWATRTLCNLSHGHEVAGLLPYPRADNPRGMGRAVQVGCEDAFDNYIGRSHPLSIYETFAARPSLELWDAGVQNAICLVARRDGQWMDHPARGSEE